jgi:hypothetical protein
MCSFLALVSGRRDPGGCPMCEVFSLHEMYIYFH